MLLLILMPKYRMLICLMISMQSLKFLSLAGNKVETLPDCPQYSCPWLEEVQLQDNRLDQLPPALFMLPSLALLDVANNKLQMVSTDPIRIRYIAVL